MSARSLAIVDTWLLALANARDDAVVLIKVPNFACWNRAVLGKNWSGFRHPDHVQYFTPATLGAMARRAGFDAHFRLYGRIPTNDNMYATLRPA